MILLVGAGEECQGSINNDVRDDKDTDPVHICPLIPQPLLVGGGGYSHGGSFSTAVFKRSFMHGRE